MEMVTEILNNVPNGTYLAVGAGFAVSLILQLLKKWLALQSEKVINFLLGALSFITVAIQYLTTAVSQNPSVLGTRTTAVVTAALAAYHFKYLGIKDLSNLLKDAKAYRERKERVTQAGLIPAGDKETVKEVPLDTVQPQVEPVAPTPIPVATESSSEFQA